MERPPIWYRLAHYRTEWDIGTRKGRDHYKAQNTHGSKGPELMSIMPQSRQGGRLRVAYQNVGRGSTNTHVLLEWGAKEEVDIIFIGEAWRDREGRGNTQQRSGYVMGGGFGKDQLVVRYWKEELKEKIRVILELKRAIGIEIEGRFIGAVYGAVGGNQEGMEDWLHSLKGVGRRQSGILLGDWNAHYKE